MAAPISRTVMVTGAAGGIGSAIVQRFLAGGDTVIATDMTSETLDGLKNRVEAACLSRLILVAADVSCEDDCAKLATFACKKAATVEVLINCAGYFPIVEFEEMSAAQWRQVIDINLTGIFLLIKAMLPLMKSKG